MEANALVWVKNEEDGDWYPSVILSKTALESGGFELQLSDAQRESKTIEVPEAHQDLEQLDGHDLFMGKGNDLADRSAKVAMAQHPAN